MQHATSSADAAVRHGSAFVGGLVEATMSLKEEQRLVLCLFYGEGVTLDQIAEILGRSEDRIAEIFYRAHASLGMCPSPEELLAPA